MKNTEFGAKIPLCRCSAARSRSVVRFASDWLRHSSIAERLLSPRVETSR
ncbi:MAG: hypothetical protein IJ630_09290 [Treponema sp.]|nr:hypothetical protein [Treponema sp.]